MIASKFNDLLKNMFGYWTAIYYVKNFQEFRLPFNFRSASVWISIKHCLVKDKTNFSLRVNIVKVSVTNYS